MADRDPKRLPYLGSQMMFLNKSQVSVTQEKSIAKE
jgi:hypothetical protein